MAIATVARHNVPNRARETVFHCQQRMRHAILKYYFEGTCIVSIPLSTKVLTMKSIRTIPLTLTALLAASVLFSCTDPNYETYGKVYMNKTISLAELWEKREELKGEVITLELDTLEGVGAGSFPNIEGFKNRKAQLWHVNDYGLYSVVDWIKFYKKHLDSLKRNRYVFAGSYEVNLVNGSDKVVKLPDWASYKGDVLEGDELLNSLAKTEYSTRKVLTGVLIDTYETVHPLPCIQVAEGKKRVVILAVTGVRHRKQGRLPLALEVYAAEECPDSTQIHMLDR